jgi:hypothetical protein
MPPGELAERSNAAVLKSLGFGAAQYHPVLQQANRTALVCRIALSSEQSGYKLGCKPTPGRTEYGSMAVELTLAAELIKAAPIILGAVIGGGLTIPGGIAGQLLTHRWTMARDTANYRREKLVLYVELIDADAHRLERFRGDMCFGTADGPQEQEPWDKASTISNLFLGFAEKEIPFMEARHSLANSIRQVRIDRLNDVQLGNYQNLESERTREPARFCRTVRRTRKASSIQSVRHHGADARQAAVR